MRVCSDGRSVHLHVLCLIRCTLPTCANAFASTDDVRQTNVTYQPAAQHVIMRIFFIAACNHSEIAGFYWFRLTRKQ